VILYIKALHIIFVISWFAGLFYLPRIFVNIALVDSDFLKKNTVSVDPDVLNSSERKRLLLMAKKLFRFTTPLMLLSIFFGLWLWVGYGIGAQSLWMQIKIIIVCFLVFYHFYCGKILKNLLKQISSWSHVKFRWFNEIPVLLLFASVLLVVVKPI
tara:strand:- start:1107 stop:1574 length:468 start_codon:yes stop_codon:yes gene_type:complete